MLQEDSVVYVCQSTQRKIQVCIFCTGICSSVGFYQKSGLLQLGVGDGYVLLSKTMQELLE